VKSLELLSDNGGPIDAAIINNFKKYQILEKNEMLIFDLLQNFWEKIVFDHHILCDFVDNLFFLAENDCFENQK
jgi:hypothetical protein